MKSGTKIIVGLLRLGALLQREGDRIAKRFDLNQQQYVVLNYIFHYQPICQREICSSLLFEKSNISKIIKKLEVLGYIVQQTSDSDKRSVSIMSTKKGEVLIKQGNLLFEEFNSRMIQQLSHEEIKILGKIIDKFQNNQL